MNKTQDWSRNLLLSPCETDTTAALLGTTPGALPDISAVTHEDRDLAGYHCATSGFVDLPGVTQEGWKCPWSRGNSSISGREAQSDHIPRCGCETLLTVCQQNHR